MLKSAAPHYATAFALDDIQFWTGTGTNRAGMVIHWSAPEVRNDSTVESPVANHSLVWGYRWNGSANAEDMFNAISAADSRLLSVVSASDVYGKAMLGFAFDLNQNGIVGIRSGANIIPRASTSGLAILSYNGVDALQSLDAGDLFWSGWHGPSWELWIGNSGNNAPERGHHRYWTPADPENPYSGDLGQWHYSETGCRGPC